MPSAYLSLQLDAVLADDLVVDAGLLHLEAGGVDQQVELVLLALEDRALRADLGDALAVGVDEVDVGPVERRQVLVVEARPLAHEHVPGLERLGRRRVLDDLVDAAVDPHHVVDVGVLLAADLLLARHRRPLLDLHRGQRRLRSSPSARRFGLPARLQLAPPTRDRSPSRRGCRSTTACAGRRTAPWRCAPRFGIDLHRGGAGADDADDLVVRGSRGSRPV